MVRSDSAVRTTRRRLDLPDGIWLVGEPLAAAAVALRQQLGAAAPASAAKVWTVVGAPDEAVQLRSSPLRAAEIDRCLVVAEAVACPHDGWSTQVVRLPDREADPAAPRPTWPPHHASPAGDQPRSP
jgi:hypothetical protein